VTPMNATLPKSLVALVAVSVLLAASTVFIKRERSTGSLLQLLGASFLVIVVLTHVFEARDLFPQMQWGHPHSVGHYLDFGSAVLGLTLIPLGYVLRRLRRARRGTSRV
jgi:hypothetical protein